MTQTLTLMTAIQMLPLTAAKSFEHRGYLSRVNPTYQHRCAGACDHSGVQGGGRDVGGGCGGRPRVNQKFDFKF